MDAHTRRLATTRRWMRASLVLPFLLLGHAFAQSNLTVFSGDGTRFTLYVNGVAQPGPDHRYELTNLSGPNVSLRAEVTVPTPGTATASFGLVAGRNYQLELAKVKEAYRLQIVSENGGGSGFTGGGGAATRPMDGTEAAPAEARTAPADPAQGTGKTNDNQGRGRGGQSRPETESRVATAPSAGSSQPPPTGSNPGAGRGRSGSAGSATSSGDYEGEYAPQANTDWDRMSEGSDPGRARGTDTYESSDEPAPRSSGDGRGWSNGGRGNNGWGAGGSGSRGSAGGWNSGSNRGSGGWGGGSRDGWGDRRGDGYGRPPVTKDPYTGKVYVLPMHPADYDRLRRRLDRTPFSDDRRMLLDFALRRNYFTTRQIAGLMSFFPFDRDRLQLAQRAYGSVVDRGRYDLLADFMTFSSTRREFYNWLDKVGW